MQIKTKKDTDTCLDKQPEIFNTLFIHKYQPLKLNDFENESVSKTLKTLLCSNVANLLLIGETCSGKTTLIQTMIKEYYENMDLSIYNENVLVINNLKEQGTVYYQTDVKSFCQTKSIVKNKKKILVLDDFDLLSETSQHVFRSYIDKYEKNVLFIASCCFYQKVIDCMLSRFISIKIPNLTKNMLMSILNKILKNENIQLEEISKKFLVDTSNNAKVLINNIEKIKLFTCNDEVDLLKPTYNEIVDLCSNININILTEYTNECLNNNKKQAIKIIDEIYKMGYSVMDILDDYLKFIKITTILTENQKYKIFPIMCSFIEAFHKIHENEIELFLFTNELCCILQEK